METASALFYAEGIHAVGVDRVVRDSGVAKATLYQHFRFEGGTGGGVFTAAVC